MTEYNGELYIGGLFSDAGGVAANNIAKWNGTNWSVVGTGINGMIQTLVVYNGELYAGGTMPNHIVKWNGTAWVPVGSGINGNVRALQVFDNSIYAGGDFTIADGNLVSHIAKWDGALWSPVGTGVDSNVTSIYPFNNELYVGGFFLSAGGNQANYIAKWNSGVGIAENNLTSSIIIYPNPAGDKIHLQDSDLKNSEIKLFNVQGELLKNISKNNISEIDVSDLPSGVYILKILDNKNVISKKITVQH